MRSLVQFWREWSSFDAAPIFEWPQVISELSIDQFEEARLELPRAKQAQVYDIKHRQPRRLKQVSHPTGRSASNDQSRYAANS